MKYFAVAFCILFFPFMTVRANVSLLLEEAIGFSAHWNSAGHAAIYLSNICVDQPERLRRCRSDENGIVMASYKNFGDLKNYHWIAIPQLPFLYGVEDREQIPIYANQEILNFLRERYWQKSLRAIIPDPHRGYWKSMIAVGLTRDIYVFTIPTTVSQDEKFIDHYNLSPNINHFRNFTSNCSDFAAEILNQYFPHSISRDWINDFGIRTPKSIAKALLRHSREKREIELRIDKINQVDGLIARSRPVRQINEEILTSPKYLIPLLIKQPILIAGLTGAYLLTRPLSPEREYRKFRKSEFIPNKYFANNNVESEQVWRNYQMEFKEIIKLARARQLIDRRQNPASFFSELQKTGRPDVDEAGYLILKLPGQYEEKIVGLTQHNLAHYDQLLAVQLMLAKIDVALSSKPSERPSIAAFEQDWRLMKSLLEKVMMK